jgi:hypothetical protein
MTTDKTKTTAKGPIDKIRISGCEVAIWANRSERGIHHSATFQRSYRDDDGEWQQTGSYFLGDLLAHRAALDIAIGRLIALRQSDE